MNHDVFALFFDQMTNTENQIQTNHFIIFIRIMNDIDNNIPDCLWIHDMDIKPHHYLSNRDRLHHDEFHRLCSTSSTIKMKKKENIAHLFDKNVNQLIR